MSDEFIKSLQDDTEVGLCSLENDSYGLTVVVKIDNYKYRVYGVPENIIRCAIGEADMDYLLGRQIRDDYVEGETDEEFDMYVVPDNDESQCFSLLVSEFKDCLKHGEISMNGFGQVVFE